MRLTFALSLLPLALLAACQDQPAADDERSASGQVLEGTISDSMLPLTTVSSQPPLLPPEEQDDDGEDTAAAPAEAAAPTGPGEESAGAAPAATSTAPAETVTP